MSANQNKLQEDLDALYDWSITWGMKFNVSKCNILRVARTHTVFDREYTLGGESLNIVESEKDLGIWLHSILGWNDHAC